MQQPTHDHEKWEDTNFSRIFHVKERDCISAINDTLPPLLGTYVLVKWMEIVCAENIKRLLPETQITVGEKITIEHTGMVRIREDVQICTTLKKQEKRKVKFTFAVTCQEKTIATGSHERVIILQKIINRMMQK